MFGWFNDFAMLYSDFTFLNDRLARHYGYAAKATGRGHAPVRTWLAEGAGFVVE